MARVPAAGAVVAVLLCVGLSGCGARVPGGSAAAGGVPNPPATDAAIATTVPPVTVPSAATPEATDPPTAAPATAGASSSGGAPLATRVTKDVVYDSGTAGTASLPLDVYAPEAAGPWPVAVMLHGGGVDKEFLASVAREAAASGLVVFVPTWGSGAAAMPSGSAELRSYNTRGACALLFARAHAADYGGDPSKLVLFGHSAGASLAAQVAYAGAVPSESCATKGRNTPVTGVVAWDGDWLPGDAWTDELLARDPAAADAISPWDSFKQKAEPPLILLSSSVMDPSVSRTFSDKAAVERFIQLREGYLPGAVVDWLEASGIANTLTFSVADEQRMLEAFRTKAGKPVELRVLPDTLHASLSLDGQQALIQALHDALGG